MNKTHQKTVLITGGTSGIGLAVAKLSIEENYKVLLVGSSYERSIPSKIELNQLYPNVQVHYFFSDLSVQSNIHKLSDEVITYINQECDGILDVLINNAGGVRDSYQSTVDGIEYQFALNHLSGFLLSYLLRNQLKNGIILFTGSFSHRKMKIHWKDVMFKHNYFIFTAYRQSKLANLMTAKLLNEKLAKLNIKSYVVDPGLVKTDIASKHTSWLVRMVWNSRSKKGTNPLVPAKTYIHLMKNRPLEGLYYKDSHIHPYNPEVDNPCEYERLFELSEKLCHIHFE
ncbi:MAG: hypothetical protein CVV58_02865 [Tenericutes bacterium HGW-Tenericutes-3]|nr:MAG: hypothetical protein CVV58_02865 [Tenericutes bacterium HGW-Tenericutes-3]